jgi:prepilin-type N-terminal cleavage/methylation domain-containing protein
MRIRTILVPRGPRHGSTGFTLVELMVSTVVVGIVLVAIIVMYVTAMQAWRGAGTRLALQRNADMGLEKVLSDVRAGSRVEINPAQTQMTIYRATASGDSTMAVYSFASGGLRNSYGTVLVSNVTSLVFTSGNGIKVMIQLSLLDNAGTSGVTGDDATIQMESVAVCRNASLY